MTNRLSYSQIEKFKFCPKAWEFHYVERYRTLEVSSALLFGSAIGKTFEHILDPNHIHLYENDHIEFYHNFRYQKINGVENVDTLLYPHVLYSKADTDIELLTRDEKIGVSNELAWHSLIKKGYLIIDSFKKNLLPLITKVHSVEEEIVLTNEEGDSSIGYADAVLDIQGYDKPIIIDFKTAARPYEQNSVANSVQLSGYLHELGEKYNTRLCGYAVFSKNITKNRTKICKDCGFDGSGNKFKTCYFDLLSKVDKKIGNGR